MRYRLHVGCNCSNAISDLCQSTTNLSSGIRKALPQLFDVDCEESQLLVYIVVKVSSNPRAVLLLRFNQFPAHPHKRLFCQFTLRHIDVDANHS